MFAYCKNNPIRYIDPTGQSAVGAIAFLAGVAIAEPTPIGEVILIVVIASVGTAVIVDKGIEVVETITEIVESSSDDSDDAPKSVEKAKDATEVDENGHPIVKHGQLPTEEDGYIAPKGGAVKGKAKGKIGWKDKYGNIWVPAPTDTSQGHGGGHWDVQSPKGGYSNVYPGGKIRGGKSPYPRLPIYP